MYGYGVNFTIRYVFRNEFDDVFKNGKSFSNDYFSLRYKNTKAECLAISFVVPVSVSRKSTERNKLKRRARSITRSYVENLKKGLIVVFFKNKAKLLKMIDLKRELIGFYKKSGLLNNF